MNISFVLAVYNKLDLTKEFYKQLRIVYPDAELIISSGGSTDETKTWLNSLKDDHLCFCHSDKKISFSETYNNGIEMVETEKLVLVHNDMVIGKYFLENLDELSSEDTLLSYTTIEPPIFNAHTRPGKVVMDLGSCFDNFNHEMFDSYVEKNKNKKQLYDGAVFFMCGYKSLFENVGYFDGFTFDPAFCEDDDFLLRAKLKGYKLKTTECAITYHFVSQTSRFGDDFKDQRELWESNSNKNFIRKWGAPNFIFQHLKYYEVDNFKYEKIKLCLMLTHTPHIVHLEPYFDFINVVNNDYEKYIEEEQKRTNFDLKLKFQPTLTDVLVYVNKHLTVADLDSLNKLQFILNDYEPGKYEVGNLNITILRPLQLPVEEL